MSSSGSPLRGSSPRASGIPLPPAPPAAAAEGGGPAPSAGAGAGVTSPSTRRTSSSSAGRDIATPSPSRREQQQFTWLPHPPPLPLGSSPSSGTSFLPGSSPGGGGGVMMQQLLQQAHQQPLSQGAQIQQAHGGQEQGQGQGQQQQHHQQQQTQPPPLQLPTQPPRGASPSGSSTTGGPGGGGLAVTRSGSGGMSRTSSAAADVLSAGSGLLLREGVEEGGPDVLSPRARRCPFVIGVAGGTASGKTTVCDNIVQRLHDQCVVMLNQDSFYRSLTEAELADVQNYNFDHPDAFDTAALLDCLSGLQAGQAVEVPTYDFSRHARGEETKRVEPADVIIVEGILVLHMPELRDQCNMKIYVDTDDDVRLARRIQRDVQFRGRDVYGVIEQYQRFVKPAFDMFVAPSRRYADIIIPWQRGDNLVAIDLITQHIQLKLRCHDLLRIYPNLEIMPSNFQVRGMHTIIRDASTSKNDFVFFSDRLSRLIVEAGLGHLPFKEKLVRTPTGHRYVGVDFTRGICGVSIIRSGEAMETALRECCQGIKVGKILVHRHGPHEEEEVVYERLPSDIAQRYVLLMDPLLGTGRTACRAVQVLLDRGVQQDKVLFLSMVAAPEAIHRLCSTYPAMKLLTSEVDRGLDEHYRIVPGIGEFGERYFSD